ncbi:MAG: exodeoxyribonuclease V subunit beta [Pseudomonadales bacterium]|jgi:exodeoxyribonuclease V beta subunit|nr:exodeoxyribonuclease V subunit beta [Pseudomonadales bacterium]MDP7595582.1 exodeoxyribonuclease V subunit beta [Pseudomonadales bacterium]
MTQLESISFPLRGERLIEASAGTGKTYTITNLYLRLLLGQVDGQEPLTTDEILVVTFTIAATEELRNRIRQRIVSARHAFQSNSASSDDQFLQTLLASYQDRQRGIKLLGSAIQMMDEAAIFTIHGFCNRMLKQNAFETGTLFNMEMNMEGDDEVIVAARDCWRFLLSAVSEPAYVDHLLGLWPTPDKLIYDLGGYISQQDLAILPSQQITDPGQSYEMVRAKLTQLKKAWLQAVPDIYANILASGINKRSYPSRRVRNWIDTVTRFANDEHALGKPDGFEKFCSSFMATKSQDGPVPDLPIFEVCDQFRYSWPSIDPILKVYALQQIRQRLQQQRSVGNSCSPDDLLTRLATALRGPMHNSIADRIRSSYPVAMVDEFQDTDSIQYEIFSRIYKEQEHLGLIMIGDPKQAIYKFRGADIYTYINARRSVAATQDRILSLDINWRSSDAMIAAVNTLFSRERAFLNDVDIPFQAVRPAPDADENHLSVAEGQPPALTFWHLNSAAKGKPKNEVREELMAVAAEETASLLNLANRGKALIHGKAITAGQIAFLVRDREDARVAKACLAKRGIGSALVRTDSVFQSDTARELLLILQAAANPANEGAIRAALSCRMMQSTAAAIVQLDLDLDAHQALLQEFSAYHRLWRDHDLLRMLNQWMNQRNIADKLLQLTDGERMLTDLRHLGELLQKRCNLAPGMHRLIHWFAHAIDDDSTTAQDEHQQRLESDRNLVQIITMHGAKGLEYDIVMVPLAAARQENSLLFHRLDGETFQAVVDFDASPQASQTIREEQLAEDLRILYVAVTRARYKCYLGVANILKHMPTLPFHDTALAYLLGLEGGPQNDETIRSALMKVAHSAATADAIEIVAIDAAAKVTPLQRSSTPVTLRDPGLAHMTFARWRLTSYSALTKDLITPYQPPGAGDSDSVPEATQTDHPAANRFSFPRGAKVGVMLHNLFEEMDFTSGEEEIRGSLSRHLQRFGFETSLQTSLQEWTTDILNTPFSSDGELALSSIAADSKVAELEFHFPITREIDAYGLNALLERYDYIDDASLLSFQAVEGMMTGLIDLVFEYEGRFYLADYKSNHLGNSQQDYAPDKLLGAIQSHRYHLQYLIYSVALHRYLQQRVSGYDYDVHFGGAYYLFLRGMAGREHPGEGVYFDRPVKPLLQQLDVLFGKQA